ncbi:unnamed protein product [Ectocarpus sp. 4 AP-2014]
MGGDTTLAFGALPSHVTTTREVRSAGGVFSNIGIYPSRSRSNQQLPETCRYAVSEMVGASEETGGVFDPLGLATDETSLYRRRVAELKHGRVCMLATVGVLVQSFVQFPDPDRSAFSNTRPLGALFQVWRERPVILLGIVALMGLIELTIGREDYGSSEAEPGKLGEFWQTARPEDPQVIGGVHGLPRYGECEQPVLSLLGKLLVVSHEGKYFVVETGLCPTPPFCLPRAVCL